MDAAEDDYVPAAQEPRVEQTPRVPPSQVVAELAAQIAAMQQQVTMLAATVSSAVSPQRSPAQAPVQAEPVLTPTEPFEYLDLELQNSAQGSQKEVREIQEQEATQEAGAMRPFRKDNRHSPY